MQREEFMLNVDWTEEVALFNVDSRYTCDAVVVRGTRKLLQPAAEYDNGEVR